MFDFKIGLSGLRKEPSQKWFLWQRACMLVLWGVGVGVGGGWGVGWGEGWGGGALEEQVLNEGLY